MNGFNTPPWQDNNDQSVWQYTNNNAKKNKKKGKTQETTPVIPIWAENSNVSNTRIYRKPKKNYLPVTIAIACSVLLLAIIATLLIIILNSNDENENGIISDTGTTSQMQAATSATTTAATTAAVTAPNDRTETKTLPNGNTEYLKYEGGVLAHRQEKDPWGSLINEQKYKNGIVVYENEITRDGTGNITYEYKSSTYENGEKTVEKIHYASDGYITNSSITDYEANGNRKKITVLNKYGDEDYIEFYENDILAYTKTIRYNAAGFYNGYIIKYPSGKEEWYDKNGNIINNYSNPNPEPEPEPDTESGEWKLVSSNAAEKIWKKYSGSGTLVAEKTERKINGKWELAQEIDYVKGTSVEYNGNIRTEYEFKSATRYTSRKKYNNGVLILYRTFEWEGDTVKVIHEFDPQTKAEICKYTLIKEKMYNQFDSKGFTGNTPRILNPFSDKLY